MSLNNWLCKYFDIEKKGYVTVYDFCAIIYIALFFIGLAFGLLYGLGGIFAMAIEPEYQGDVITAFKYVLYILCITISVCIVFYIILRIGDIKIAKCPMKEKEESRQEEREGE